MRGKRYLRVLTDDDRAEFLDAATRREDPLWREIDAFLTELGERHLLRATKIRRDIRWMRKQAYRHGKTWGLG